MGSRIEVLAFAVSLATLVLIFELIRKRVLREEYALLWLSAGLFIMVLSLWRGLLDRLASWVGIYYPPAALFVVAGLFGFFLSIHFSLVLSRLSDQTRSLAQEVALLRDELSRTEGAEGRPGDAPPGRGPDAGSWRAAPRAGAPSTGLTEG